ncbi:LPO_1073/Vpar_1526 family protein [Mycolicibacterium stellerae]|uniref:LPO_1073/Vpar_1526 family protein n=1 Tax=Mycolicibacterium stellerae TaxID=2358193 RepID=UPI000F0B8190|nr:LPO_1073/Vpar_1526 family protein [Mycolicibacterium stellerae]
MTAKQGQQSGDQSTNYQAGGNIVINQGITEERAREIVAVVSSEVMMREGRAIAETVITERVDYLTNLVFERINEKNPELFHRFEDPRFLAALTDIQRSYAEIGDEELGEVLASLIVELGARPIRTMHEIALRQAIKIAPQLSPKHLRGLAVSMHLSRLNFTRPFSTEALIEQLAAVFRPYYGQIPTSSIDFSFMGSLGLGSYMEGLQDLGSKPYQLLYRRNLNSMYPAFMYDELKEDILTDDEAGREMALKMLPIAIDPSAVLRNDDGQVLIEPDNMELRVSAEHEQRILSGAEKNLSEREKMFRTKIKNRSLTAEQFRDRITEVDSDFGSFLEEIESVGILNFQLSPIGIVVARHEIGEKNPHFAAQIDAALDEL